MDISQLITLGIGVALVTGFIGFRIGQAVGRSSIRQLESELEQWRQWGHSRTRIINEGKLVHATLTSIDPGPETTPGFMDYTVNAEFTYPGTGIAYTFKDTFSVNTDSISTRDDMAEVQIGQEVRVFVLLQEPDNYLLVRPW